MNTKTPGKETNSNCNLKDFSAKEFFTVLESYRTVLSEKDSLSISSAPELRVEIENKWKAATRRMQETLIALHGKEAAIYHKYTMADGGPRGEGVRILKDVHFIENAWDVIAEIFLGVNRTSFDNVTNHTGYLNTISRNVLNSNSRPKASDGIIGACCPVGLPDDSENDSYSDDESISIQAAHDTDEDKYSLDERDYVEIVPMDIDSRKLRVVKSAYNAKKINSDEYKLLYLIIHGYKMKEVSVILNIPQNTLSPMKTRAERKLLPFAKREIAVYGPVTD